MSAEEFGEWQVMFNTEQLHPANERLQHAQVLAALHNGPLSKPDKTLWQASRFLDLTPWALEEQTPAEPAQPTAEQLAKQVAAINAKFEA